MIFKRIISLWNKLSKRKVKKMAKKYDIVVHDQDPQVKPYPQNGLIAENVESLKKMFSMCGQNIEIVREYEDDETRNYGKPKQIETPKDFEFANGGGMDKAPGFMHVDPNLPQYNPTITPTTTVTKRPPISFEPPRFFEIGGIKCKMENGKMYQKQWMRLSDTESLEFRIVSDSNNKICPIKGKHIEVMKWVLVEDGNCENENNKSELQLIGG